MGRLQVRSTIAIGTWPITRPRAHSNEPPTQHVPDLIIKVPGWPFRLLGQIQSPSFLFSRFIQLKGSEPMKKISIGREYLHMWEESIPKPIYGWGIPIYTNTYKQALYNRHNRRSTCMCFLFVCADFFSFSTCAGLLSIFVGSLLGSGSRPG